MSPNIALPADDIVAEHVREAAFLWSSRRSATSDANFNVLHLAKLDRRITAHIDGIAVAGQRGLDLCRSETDAGAAGTVFVAAGRAIANRQSSWLESLLSIASESPTARAEIVSACGWFPGRDLQGVVATFLASSHETSRLIGLGACGVHRVNPGLDGSRWLDDPSGLVRARALRTAGELGARNVIQACADAVRDTDPEAACWGAWSAVLLGDLDRPLKALSRAGAEPGPHRLRAFRLALLAQSVGESHADLQELAREPGQIRWLIQGAGYAGDPVYVPWLVKQMADPKLSRLAGEALTTITGVDLDLSDLNQRRPDNVQTGPTDEPDDENVDMDADDGLPWPDAVKVEAWWSTNGNGFKKGTRYFMGAPVTRDHCIEVLKNGYQRQRILAAHYLCLLEPGTPLFNTSAPAWRQQRLLAQMA